MLRYQMIDRSCWVSLYPNQHSAPQRRLSDSKEGWDKRSETQPEQGIK
jgi:hypothetical protein